MFYFQRQSKKHSPILTIIFVLLLLLLATGIANAEPAESEIRFWLNNFYVEKIDWNEIDDTSVEAILESLEDPYTSYLTPKELDDFMTHLGGAFGGIGIHIEQIDGIVTVTSPISGTPAFEVGLEPMDKIVQVNGLDVVGTPMEQVVDLIRGEPGTTVDLTILRGEAELSFTITRALIEVKSVENQLVDQYIGYVKVNMFGEKTAAELEQALDNLEQQGALGYIIDLRYNGGGYLDSALEIADLLIPAGKPIVHVVDRSGAMETFSTTNKGINKPLVVLVNEGSASASEILAAAVKENGAGVILGQDTFGKASVQSLINLSDGGVLKFTTAYYLTPQENNINGLGLKPNVYIEDRELQHKEAIKILKRWIGNEYQIAKPKAITLFVGKLLAIVDGKEIALGEMPFIKDDLTYVPLRIIGEKLGLQIDWDGDKREITITKGEKSFTFQPHLNVAFIGGQEYAVDAPVVIQNNRSYIPIRSLIEFLGGQVQYFPSSKQINISY
ncbi:MAG: S41 family peptidase [Bacillota bacterium]|nr:S41 family peptidase [Bacillota bacterium]